MHCHNRDSGHPNGLMDRPLNRWLAGGNGSSLSVAGRAERASCRRWMCCSARHSHPRNRIEVSSLEDPRRAAP